jgi:hypothetical protein
MKVHFVCCKIILYDIIYILLFGKINNPQIKEHTKMFIVTKPRNFMPTKFFMNSQFIIFYIRVAYVIELKEVPDVDKFEVHLDLRGHSRQHGERETKLVLKAPSQVTWRVYTKKMQGLIHIVVCELFSYEKIKNWGGELFCVNKVIIVRYKRCMKEIFLCLK